MHWRDLPAELRAALEERLAAAVVEAHTQPGGFSPGLAARLRLSDGRRVFMKAVSAGANPDSPAMHRREAQVAAALPPTVPAPRFLWSYDTGEWVALAFEDLEGRHPHLPWRRNELQQVVDAIEELVADLTPSPIEVISLAKRMEEMFQGWRLMHAAQEAGDPLDGLSAWPRRHLARLAELESRWSDAAAGVTLLHFDLRADNILLTANGARFVDWPHASIGTGWAELVQILPSIAMQGGPKPWEVFDTHPLGRNSPAADVTAVVAALSGFFLQRSRLPPPPGLPTLRAFQREQGLPALEWVRRRTGWD